MSESPSLFAPLTQRSLTLRNRLVISPMCMYRATDGLANDWHLVHLGSRAVGGAGVVCAEATGVVPEGRITPGCLGLWSDAHVPMLARIAEFVRAQGAVPAMQLAHAGRKASTARPWEGASALSDEDGGWEPVAPSALAYHPRYRTPRALDEAGIAATIAAFADAAKRALAAGFEIAEVHGAHGYLIHQFLSPLSNTRDDRWGGSFENRARFALEVTRAVRAVWPEHLPVWVRLSATDWAEGGWDIDECVRLAALLREAGAELIDCSSGGNVPQQKIALTPGYQVPFAARIRREAGIATGAVGLITSAEQADAIVRAGEADVVLIARESLRDPYFPLHAAHALGVKAEWPKSYERARP